MACVWMVDSRRGGHGSSMMVVVAGFIDGGAREKEDEKILIVVECFSLASLLITSLHSIYPPSLITHQPHPPLSH